MRRDVSGCSDIAPDYGDIAPDYGAVFCSFSQSRCRGSPNVKGALKNMYTRDGVVLILHSVPGESGREILTNDEELLSIFIETYCYISWGQILSLGSEKCEENKSTSPERRLEVAIRASRYLH